MARTAAKTSTSKPKKRAKPAATSQGAVPGATADMRAFAGKLKGHGIAPGGLSEYGTVDGKPIYQLLADGDAAVTLWRKLRKVVDKTGYWPVIVGQRSKGGRLEGLIGPDAEAAQFARLQKKALKKTYDVKMGATAMILQGAGDLDVDAWIEKKTEQVPTGEDDEWAALAEEMGQEVPKATPNKTFRGVRETLSGKPLKDVVVVLWPTREGAAVPALMRYGGWNACPLPHEQVAMFRRWKARYDAEPVVMAHDVVEMQVGRPPKTDAAALELAREQYAFCDDIVVQGTLTLERLAGSLKNGTVWFFWWD